jgi:carboxylesterase type B
MIVHTATALMLSLQLSSSIESVAAVPSIQTQSGLVKGRLATGTSDVAEYLGIPYVSTIRCLIVWKFLLTKIQAQPPVGELRWAPPQSYNGSNTIDGTEFVCSFRLFN